MNIKKYGIALVGAAMVTIAGGANADGWHHEGGRNEGWHNRREEHEWRHENRREHGYWRNGYYIVEQAPVYYYPQQPVYYQPRPIYANPAPVYYQQPYYQQPYYQQPYYPQSFLSFGINVGR